MQKIVPHLWFDTEAKEAAEFYVAAFSEFNSTNIINTTVLHDTPGGDAMTVSFQLGGYEFMAISAGPIFKPNPAISFMVNFDPSRDPKSSEHLEKIYHTLAEGGIPMMPLDEYSFSKKYAWIQDKYGVSWQLILTDPDGDPRPFIMPSLLFVTDSGKVSEEARAFYVSVFKDAKEGIIAKYPAGMEPNVEGAVMFSDFTLEGQWFTAMDGPSSMHNFAFTEGVSLIVRCDTQEEIDYYWNKLSAVPESEQCGWLKDKYGVSWQIVPTLMDKMMREGSEQQINAVTQAFLQMKKFDIAKLEAVYKSKQ